MATVELLFGDVKQGEQTILQIKNVTEYRVLDGRDASPNKYTLEMATEHYQQQNYFYEPYEHLDIGLVLACASYYLV